MTEMWTRWRAEARQRRHHRPFRIAAPAWDATERARLSEVLAGVTAALSRADASEEQQALSDKDLATAATSLWKAQRKIAKSGVDTSREGRQVARYLRAAREAFTEAGVVIQDHDGMAFHSGLSLEVLAFEDDPELTAEVVTQTVRPSVYLSGQRIQMGQVIVGCPPGRAARTTGEGLHG